ncbi:TIR-NBS-LRR class disease resistance protein [Rhynchospora pubera]|uniref:TIR-NBS-LRR class disease resistance protein n=1 Tax=Rhynchospora pubera TaxID=906938 RepID=A0AAV8C2D4_9POAL|nr:TIR-NBS-LRR class disease resistance protein [Rhynchospora pubera]
MPPHLGKVVHLQTLSAYIVGKHTGNGIDEIRDLNLGDLLELYNLYNVRDVAEAKDANLRSKTNLEILALSWGSSQLVMSNKSNDLELLEALEPPCGLKVLKVKQYGDLIFATWLTNPMGLQNLVELHLIGCSQCKTLPAVWMLSSLQVLCLKHMMSLTCICSILHVDNEDNSKLFPSLKKLILVDLNRLERWQEEETSLQMTLEFPLLREIEITKCPILKTMPHVPNLRIMRLDSTDMFFMSKELTHSLLDFWGSLVSLENLDICNCKNLFDWPLEEFRNLIKLKRLSFRMCPNLNGLFSRQLIQGEAHLPRLLTLEFYRCVSLKEVPKCSSVLNLEVDECSEVKSISDIINLEMLQLSCTSWNFLPTGLGDLKKLESLQVSECYNLTCLPDELAGITSLQTLIINKCPRVKSLPNGLNQVLFGLEKFQIIDCPDLEKSCIEGPYSSMISRIDTKRNDSSSSSTNFEVFEER